MMYRTNLFTLLVLFEITILVLSHLPPTNPRLNNQFKDWKQKFGKNYNSLAQQSYRAEIFLSNLNNINAHNSDQSRTYDQAVNLFTDLTQQEFKASYLGLNLPPEVAVDIQNNGNSRLLARGGKGGSGGGSTTPTTYNAIDWTALGFVTPVKNQGNCGSCWAFSANAALESLSIKSDGTTRIFSQRQIVDCSDAYGNLGCNGGWMNSAFDYVRDYGVFLDHIAGGYPQYTQSDQACVYDTYKDNQSLFRISSYTSAVGCATLLTAIQGRPLSVAVDATGWGYYSSGVFSNCGTNINHGVLLTGIDASGNWIIKNSWGTSWGNNGYIKLPPNNSCRICDYPSYPNL